MYTWKRRNPLSMSQIDSFFCPAQTVLACTECEIIPGFRSDHSFLTLTICVQETKRGQGYWKFNNAHLSDKNYLDQMNELIDEYNKETHNLDDAQHWEVLKMTMQNFTMDYCKNKARTQRIEFDKLNRQLATQEKRLQCINLEAPNIIKLIDKINEKVDVIKKQLEEMHLKRAKGAMLRARVRWHEQGERGTSYFLRLEKSRAKTNCMSATKRHDGTITRSIPEIIAEQKKFYTRLYSKDMNVQFQYENSPVQLNVDQREQLDRDLQMEEFSEALKGMASNKAPGGDGWTADFLKVFWGRLKTGLFNAFKAAIRTGRLPLSCRQGILTLLPKMGRNLLEIRHWRPISLLCVDFKVFSKVLSNRMKNSLETVIDKDQQGFMKGRSISDNIRKALDIMEYTK